MRELTIRQIEIIRALMIAGSVSGAARLLNVAQPGISRAIRHIEAQIGISLFSRQGGRLVPAPETKDIFAQANEVHARIENLKAAIGQYGKGQGVELSIGSAPSIAHVMVPRAIGALRAKFPDLRINVELLKLEETVDYLMLRRGELVCTSYLLDHPSIRFQPLAKGELVCIAHRSHPLARRQQVSVAEIAAHPLIGIDPGDPYGRIMAQAFAAQSLPYTVAIRARFGSTVIGLVAHNLGIAVLDSFTVYDLASERQEIATIPIVGKTGFLTYVATRRDIDISGFGAAFVVAMRKFMTQPASHNIML